MKNSITSLLLLLGLCATAQVKVGDNPTNVNASAVLEMESTDKGMLLPRMTASQRDAISNPSNALLIYNTSEDCINIYNAASSSWKSICSNEAEGTADFSVDCSTLVVSGTYATGTALDPETNYITVSVNVAELGTYNIVSNAAGMFFSAIGTFTTLGTQDIVLVGQGYPLVSGTNFVSLQVNNSICTTVINVTTGIATITGCGTIGSLTGNIYANAPIAVGDVFQSYTAGPAYTGGGVYGITSSTVNGIRINQPVNGTFITSGAPIDYFLSGTPIMPGNSTVNYSINGYACSFTVPVQSGTGLASGVTCSGTLSGTYQVGTVMNSGNTKVVTLTVSQAGSFYIRTNTVNGIYFSGSATAAAAGPLNVTLTASGTPTEAATNSYTVVVSNTATTFTNCSFNVTAGLPTTVPAFNTLSCASLSAGVSYIKASNAGANDQFGGRLNTSSFLYGKGTKISADGLTLAIGAILEGGDLTGGPINSTNNDNWNTAGAVYVYTRSSITANWVFQAKIKPSQLNAGDIFGNALDLSNDGNTLVVGSIRESGSGTGVNPAHNNSAGAAGAAYVFTRSGSTWSQQAYLKANQSDANDVFGSSVAVSGDGNTVAVGTPAEDGSGTGINPAVNNNKANSGAVHIFNRSSGVWSYGTYIKASNPDSEDHFGCSVELNNDGTTLAVGARYEDGSNPGINPVVNNSTSAAGAVYVFQKNAGTWAQQAYLKAGNVSATDQFGANVDLDGSGNTLLVGAHGDDGSGKGVNPGANESTADAGAAYIFKRSGTAWSQSAYLKSSNPTASDYFGYSVSIANDGASVILGAFGEDGSNGCINPADNNSTTDSGAAYLFSLVGGNWVYSYMLKMPNAVGSTSGDYFGAGVSINSDGRSIAIAAFNEDGSGMGINPTANNSAADAGCVIVYTK
ncbi:hypothetical protein HYN59_13570 [Flavobacterium album]|uniref:Integrin n=1 Tax=Flavobacterium album TaxID=2175091 RepID=A0A2S1R071_9FLAO|nr:FG-GAP repeat protein [Flavobacterium album]AWH86077.1 hypothetical protein HYN59_13570 [Flavobacterium album]